MLLAKPSIVGKVVLAVLAISATIFQCGASFASSEQREYDIVVFGATGLLGSLGSASLVGAHDMYLSVPKTALLSTGVGRAKIALAARNLAKLQALKDRFAATCSPNLCAYIDRVELIVADLSDEASLDAFVRKTKVVVNFAGPSWDSMDDAASLARTTLTPGLLSMKCALAGTHYVDVSVNLTPWFTKERDAVDGTSLGPTLSILDAVARTTGAVISPSTGCISVPHELTAWLAADALGGGRGSLPRRISSYEVAYSKVAKGEMLRKDGSNAFPWNMMYDEELDQSVQMLGAIPVQQSLMEVLAKPSMELLADQMGWDNVSYQQFSPTNQWYSHFEYIRHDDGDIDFLRNARLCVVTEVEAMDGRIQTVSMQQFEGIYEEASRESIEMALALVFQKDQVPASSTGGVMMAASGWGHSLVRNLVAIGNNVTVETPGKGAAPVLARLMRTYGML